MMKTPLLSGIVIDPFELSKMLLEAESPHLTEDDRNYILGSCRARSHSNLAELLVGKEPALLGLHRYRALAQIQALFKKNASFGSDAAREAATWAAFHKAESQCRITNRRLDFYMLYPDRLNATRHEQIKKMRAVIAEILGSAASFLDQIPGLLRITNGASDVASRRFSDAARKLCKRKGSCYVASLPFVDAYAMLTGSLYTVKPTHFNRIAVVPKQWDKSRTIAAEAEWVLPFQLCIDAFLKERLRVGFGIDLRDQTRNQRLANQGSLDGSIATIDLAAASDTVAKSIVDFLLPPEWASLFKMLRAPAWRYRDETDVYAKFSSMGNGYTFVLETMIFYAVCYACGASVASVYGDDIAVSTEVSEEVISLLKFLGFTTNKAKSFTSGPFRESCGTDWYAGVNVRPYFLRKNKLDRKDLCGLVNGLVPHGYEGTSLWKYLTGLIDRFELPLIPFCDNNTAGVHCEHVATVARFNRKLFRFEYRALVYQSRDVTHGIKDYWYALFLFRNRAFAPIDVIEELQTTKRIRSQWVTLIPSGKRVSPIYSEWTDHLLQTRRLRSA